MDTIREGKDHRRATAEGACVRCGHEDTEAHELILDGEQPTTLLLCESCRESCYDSVLAADWIEEA